MTLVKALPACSYRYGRTDMVQLDNGKMTARFIFCCGYREVDSEECIMCTGYSNIKFEFKIVTFMRMEKDLRFKSNKKPKNIKDPSEGKESKI